MTVRKCNRTTPLVSNNSMATSCNAVGNCCLHLSSWNMSMRLRLRTEAGQSQKACLEQQEAVHTLPPDPLGERPSAPTHAPSDLDHPQCRASVRDGSARRTLPGDPHIAASSSSALASAFRRLERSFSDRSSRTHPRALSHRGISRWGRATGSGNVTRNLRVLRSPPFSCSNVQVHDLPCPQLRQPLVDVGGQLVDHYLNSAADDIRA